MQQDQIDGWIAYNQVEPLWPTVLNWFRQKFGFESIAESEPEAQTDEEMALSAFKLLGSMLPEDQAKDFKRELEEYQQKLDQDEAQE